MRGERVERYWIEAFRETLSLCAVASAEPVVILSETRSRSVLVHLAELALLELGARPCHVVLPSRSSLPVAGRGLVDHPAAVAALRASGLVVDLTNGGLVHGPESEGVIGGSTRVLMIGDAHPDTLARLVPDRASEAEREAIVQLCRTASRMSVVSSAGTDLMVDMGDAVTMGIPECCDRPGTVARWPGGVLESYPAAGAVDGRLVLAAGDVNLMLGRYLSEPVALMIEDGQVIAIEGDGVEATLMRRHLERLGERSGHVVRQVGIGLNRRARYEALAMGGESSTNVAELRALAGSFLLSTGSGGLAGRFTEGAFDLALMGCSIALDGERVVEDGRLLGGSA